MNWTMLATMVLYAALFFAAGCGWGQWWAERNARKERAALERGRLLVSMPINAKDAANALDMLHDLMRTAESERAIAGDALGPNV